MTTEEAIKEIEGMEQIECICEDRQRRRPALQMAISALQAQVEPRTNFERWRNNLAIDFFKTGKVTIFNSRRCPHRKHCPGAEPDHSCWDMFMAWAETEVPE